MGAAQGRIIRDSVGDSAYRSERDKVSMRVGDGSFVSHVASEHGWYAQNSGSRYEVNTPRLDYVETSGLPMDLTGNQYGIVPDSRSAECPVQPGFDFNSTQPLPWRTQQTEREKPLQFREFAPLRDPDLLAYLDSRNISVGFLIEIDQFLRGHPEITSCPQGLTMLQTMNALSPLEAYRIFIKGYTRPARYRDGIVTTNFSLPVGFRPPPLKARLDPELEEFFDGFEYRWDILENIDRTVAKACVAMATGRFVNSSLRRLICYAVWGNPVDAYKWYEYNIQEDYITHLYLPEHVVLNAIPKPANYTKPAPLASDVPMKHSHVRARMARANDEGVDVLDVLVSEYRLALVRRGYRRKEVDNLCNRAKARLDTERSLPKGIDIVDMLMDDAVNRQSMRRPAVSRPVYKRTYAATGRSARVHTRKPPTGPRIPSFLSDQAVDLRTAKRNMERLYTMEEDAMASYTRPVQDFASLSNLRGTAERRYVNVLIRYLRDSHQMTAVEAADLQRYFTRQRMNGMGPVNKAYLLSLFPRELA